MFARRYSSDAARAVCVTAGVMPLISTRRTRPIALCGAKPQQLREPPTFDVARRVKRYVRRVRSEEHSANGGSTARHVVMSAASREPCAPLTQCHRDHARHLIGNGAGKVTTRARCVWWRTRSVCAKERARNAAQARSGIQVYRLGVGTQPVNQISRNITSLG